MVDLSHLRNNRKVVTATLAGMAVVAISVGVGVGLTRRPENGGKSPIDDSVPTIADTKDGGAPLGDKESFLRVDVPVEDVLDEVPEADIVDEVDKSKRVGVNYNGDWGGGGNTWGGGGNTWSGGGSTIRCPDGSIAAKAGKGTAVSAAGKSGKSGQDGQPGRRCKYLALPAHLIVL